MNRGPVTKPRPRVCREKYFLAPTARARRGRAKRGSVLGGHVTWPARNFALTKGKDHRALAHSLFSCPLHVPAAALMMVQRMCYVASRVFAAVGLHSSWTAPNWAPTSIRRARVQSSPHLGSPAAPALSCSNSLGIRSTHPLLIASDGGDGQIALAPLAVLLHRLRRL